MYKDLRWKGQSEKEGKERKEIVCFEESVSMEKNEKVERNSTGKK